MSMDKQLAHCTSCANCGAELAGPYCHHCGQKAHLHKSLLHLGEEFLHGILHFDSKGLRTLPVLVTRPGLLTRCYIDGHRTRYVSPLALFLFMVFCMFFVASLTSGRGGSVADLKNSPFVVAERRSELQHNIALARTELAAAEKALTAAKAGSSDAASAQARVQEAREDLAAAEKVLRLFNQGDAITSTGTPGLEISDLATGWPAADEAIRHAAKNPELTVYKLKSAGSKYLFLLVPLSLPFLWLMFFWRRGVTMYDHAVFALYSLSFMALVFILLFVCSFAGWPGLGAALVLGAPPVHMFAQLRGTYQLSFGSALWRTCLLLCISTLVMLLYLIVILMLSLR